MGASAPRTPGKGKDRANIPAVYWPTGGTGLCRRVAGTGGGGLWSANHPQTVFVCSMADLFGRWVPTSWIVEVLDACRRAPQHRYLFLTKNPARYLELDHMALLPHESNFWYGSTVANEDAEAMYTMQGVAINSFWSMEQLLGPVDMSKAEGLPQWVILGAETGNRREKVVPRREWVDQIVQFCAENEIPVFFKDNIRAHFQDLPPSTFPWDDRESKTAKWAANFMGRFERQV